MTTQPAVAVAVAADHDPSFGCFDRATSSFKLPPLPFSPVALEHVTCAETFENHHGKHHAGYVTNANAGLKAYDRTFDNAADVVAFARDRDDRQLFEQAGQALNHAFFWLCHAPSATTGGGVPRRDLKTAVDAAFGDFDGLVAKAKAMGKARVGSGWVWLAAKPDGSVSLIVTEDADTLLDRTDVTALLVCDIWEHAYYLDRQSDRVGWIGDFFANAADWSFAEARHSMATLRKKSA